MMSKNISPIIIHYKVPLRGLKFSSNKSYAGIHWTKRKEIKDSILSVAGWFCKPIPKIQSYPIEIEYRYFFRTRSLDTLNTAMVSKMFEDSFRALGHLQDDSPKFVKRSILEVNEIGPKKDGQGRVVKESQLDKENEDYVEITFKNIIN